MTASAVLTPTHADCVFLQVRIPGRPVVNGGVFLLDPATDRLHYRLRRDWEEIGDEDDAEFLSSLEVDFETKLREMGGAAFLVWFEENASNFLGVTAREPMQVADFPARLNRLYREHVSPSILPFRTHLPRYSFRAAAGSLGPEDEIRTEDWEETPASLRLTEDMFVGHVEGRSMEPRIPDGSLCVFRRNVTGARQGRLLLIERPGLSEESGRYTVKRYRSEKRRTEEGWEHTRILMEPLNPEFETWELTPDEFRVLAEFVCVLRPDTEG